MPAFCSPLIHKISIQTRSPSHRPHNLLALTSSQPFIRTTHPPETISNPQHPCADPRSTLWNTLPVSRISHFMLRMHCERLSRYPSLFHSMVFPSVFISHRVQKYSQAASYEHAVLFHNSSNQSHRLLSGFSLAQFLSPLQLSRPTRTPVNIHQSAPRRVPSSN